MIGQKHNLELISQWTEVPRFIILTGERGSGRKLLARVIGEAIGGYVVYVGKSVDEVREVIQNSYNCSAPTLYVFADADKMSPQAKNSLLKVTEDPPRQAYFIMTVEDMQNTLVTLKSRSMHISMEPYSPEEIMEFLSLEGIRFELAEGVQKLAINPGQAKELTTLSIDEFVAFCNSVIDNIGKVTGVNAFKLATRLKYKDEGEGYDPLLFLNAVMAICRQRIFTKRSGRVKTEDVRILNNFVQTIWACSECKNQLRITGVRKDSTMDMWVLKMREIWTELSED